MLDCTLNNPPNIVPHIPFASFKFEKDLRSNPNASQRPETECYRASSRTHPSSSQGHGDIFRAVPMRNKHKQYPGAEHTKKQTHTDMLQRRAEEEAKRRERDRMISAG